MPIPVQIGLYLDTIILVFLMVVIFRGEHVVTGSLWIFIVFTFAFFASLNDFDFYIWVEASPSDALSTLIVIGIATVINACWLLNLERQSEEGHEHQ